MSSSDPRPEGFVKSPEESTYPVRIAIALAVALIAAPLCLGLRIDWDRTLPLLLLPALCLLRAGATKTAKGNDRSFSGGNSGERWILLAAAICCVASALLAIHPARAAATTAAWALIIGGGIAATRLANNPKAIRMVLASIVVGGMVSLAVVRLRISPENGIPLFSHPRMLGLYMLIALICAIGLAFTLPKEKKRTAAGLYIVAAILCGGMIWSGGRTPFVALAAGVGLWLILTPKPQRLGFAGRVLGVLAAGLIISIALGQPIAGLGWNFAFGRTVNSGSLVELSSNRSAIWEVSLKEFTHNIWLGHGADFYLFQTPRVSGASGAHPHNFVVQWLLDFGVLGTIALLGLLGSRIVRGVSKAANPLNIVATVGLATCTVAALLDGVFYHAVLFMPAAIFAGLCYSAPSETKSHKIFGALGALAVAVSTAFVALNVWLFYELKYSVPASPQSAPAVALRYFPSNLHGLWTWLDAWKKSDPQVAVNWGEWAQTEAVQPEYFAIYTARQHLERREFVAAESELQKILSYVVPEQRKPIQGMINEVRRQAALAQQPQPAGR